MFRCQYFNSYSSTISQQVVIFPKPKSMSKNYKTHLIYDQFYSISSYSLRAVNVDPDRPACLIILIVITLTTVTFRGLSVKAS